MGAKKTLVIRNGTLIDGSGRPPVRNDTIVIAGNRIRSIGASPPDMSLEDPRSVEVIDATGQWIMPGLGKHGVNFIKMADSRSGESQMADIAVLQGGKHLSWVIKDGKIVDLNSHDEMLTFAEAAE
jgi:N-acetylglucosamine-6-phosphate deacetylase